MLYAGQTMNMLSMFAFLMALGLLVDDAIVIGENIYAHRQRGSDYVTAAVEGTYEVLPSVLASVGTTIIAFAPMLFVPGIMGKFFAVIPFAVITMLLISLLESTFVLPCHLAHVPRSKSAGPGWINRWSDRLVGGLISRLYLPLLRRSLDHPLTVVAIGATVLLLTAGFYQGGFIPFQLFPRLDADTIQASVTVPDGTPAAITDEATRRLERAIQEINDEHARRGGRLATLIHRTVGDTGSSATMTGNPPAGGSHTGSVQVELVEGSRRSMKSHEIVMQWRKRAGEFPGVESLTFGSVGHGPGGAAVEFKLLGDRQNMAALEDAVELCKARLGKYQGTLDIEDDSRPGKWEFQLTVKDSAQAMGVPLADLAGTVRAAYYGEEVMRLQRGRHEVKLMVRYPPEERHSLAAFDDLRVRTGGGAERPLTELAHLDVRRGYSTINRLDQRRAITITADVDESVAEADKIVADLKEHFVPQLLAKPEFAGLAVRWEGQQEQSSESMGGLFRGFLIALVAMFALLTLEFRSYGQPLLILLIIPFGAVGAVVGHVIMGMPLSLFSLFGMVALSGVVVNDSIVLIDFINRRVRDGVPLKTALLDAGSRRFRAVALTSLTTVAGLMPILFETSFQAQFLIPMATSLSFGLSFATLLVLIMVPTWYLLYFRLTGGEVSPLQPEPVVDALEQPNDDELESPARAPWATDLPVGQAVPDRRNG
jgi:multidrug efflux pump subunit AcrB